LRGFSVVPEAAMPVSKQQIRFCTSHDGERIAYATSGDGPPLVKAANWLSHLEFDWESPAANDRERRSFKNLKSFKRRKRWL
jgi:hypothetical protein